jgi:alkylation response protein AidB-like acyl-CoA dehydrogenase
LSALADATAQFVEQEVRPDVGAWDRADDLPDAILDRLGELGIAGALVPEAYGGPGLGVADLVPVWRTLSQGWISLTGAVNPTGLATALLVRHGTEAQRQRWLPVFARGEGLASFSITEPQAGSDLKRLETSAAPGPGGGLVLNGTKRWIAGGRSSPVIFMMVGVDGADRPSCVVLPAEGRGGPGWIVGDLDKVGYRGVESAAYTFDGFHAAGAEVLGGDEAIGRGAAQMLDALDVGRVNVACRALGIIDRALHRAVEECTEREIGQGVLGDHTHAQLRVGEVVARRSVVEAAIERAARAIDARTAADAAAAADQPADLAAPTPDAADGPTSAPGPLSTAAKVVASDTAVWAVDQASRLAASRSYTAGEELARLRRDAPQTQIGEGANDALLFALAKPLLAGR